MKSWPRSSTEPDFGPASIGTDCPLRAGSDQPAGSGGRFPKTLDDDRSWSTTAGRSRMPGAGLHSNSATPPAVTEKATKPLLAGRPGRTSRRCWPGNTRKLQSSPGPSTAACSPSTNTHHIRAVPSKARTRLTLTVATASSATARSYRAPVFADRRPRRHPAPLRSSDTRIPRMPAAHEPPSGRESRERAPSSLGGSAPWSSAQGPGERCLPMVTPSTSWC